MENSIDMNSYIPDQTIIDHFKATLQDENARICITNKSENGVLDYEITNEELHLAFVITYPDILLKLFNSILVNIQC